VIELSVVVPAYDEERRLGDTVARIRAYLDHAHARYELVLVDDGSRDGTLALMRTLAGQAANVRVVALRPNRGKGRAVAEGVKVATGELVLFTDADLSASIDELPKLEAALIEGAAIAIGSRAAPGAREIDQPLHRRLMGRTFNLMVRAVIGAPFQDTQCGFKLFRGDAGRALFNELRTDGFAFDVEILLRARRKGLAIAEVPVRWLNSDGSRVQPLRHSLQMLRDLLRIRLLR
jgi:dolichyl-phosphate beta-glucosyltransferase